MCHEVIGKLRHHTRGKQYDRAGFGDVIKETSLRNGRCQYFGRLWSELERFAFGLAISNCYDASLLKTLNNDTKRIRMPPLRPLPLQLIFGS